MTPQSYSKLKSNWRPSLKRLKEHQEGQLLKELEEERDAWKKTFEELNKTKKGGQALDDCNAKVKELQRELAKELHQRMDLEKKAKDVE